jgi:hypothetical protein
VIRARARGDPLPVLAVVFALEMKGVLLDLGVAERLQYPAPVSAQEVVGHVRVEVEIVRVIQKVSVIKISDYIKIIMFPGASNVRLRLCGFFGRLYVISV